MPAFRGRGGRGRGGGGHQRHGGGHQRPGGGHQRHHFNRRQDERDSEWFQNVRSNHDAVDIEFADYNGEKKHELPEEFVKMLNADQTEAKDDNYLQESDFGITEYVSNLKDKEHVPYENSYQFLVFFLKSMFILD